MSGLADDQLIIYSLSTVIICRFHLELQRRNTHLNTNTSQGLSTISVGSFRAASQRMHDVVMAEFGGSLVDECVEAEAMGDVTPDPDISSGTTGDVMELEEFQSQPQCW